MSLPDENAVSKALEYLAQTDEDYGRLRARAGTDGALQYAVKMREAVQFELHDGPQTERTMKARASDEYRASVENLENGRADYYIMDAKRKRAELVIEVFRTLEASRRKGNIV